MMLLQPDPALFSFINQGALTVDGIDDVEEMKIADVSRRNLFHRVRADNSVQEVGVDILLPEGTRRQQ